MTPVKNLLADYLGIEPSDIKDNDSLTDELHMSPADITDFNSVLEQHGYDVTKLDYNEIETFAELVEALTGI